MLQVDDVLFVGGAFNLIGGVASEGVALWNGESWEGLAGGVSGIVGALEWFDDGSGPSLFVGGQFFSAGGLPIAALARWNGQTWAPLGAGLFSGGVSALAVYDDGSGPALYAAGEFEKIGQVVVNRIAKWDGQTWSPLGAGITDANGIPYKLAVYDDGSGPALYMGGWFQEVDGQPLRNLARWNGRNWSGARNDQLPQGAGGFEIWELKVLDDGHGSALFATGPGILQKWNGQTWTRYAPLPLWPGYGAPWALEVFDSGDGVPRLHIGGEIPFGVWPNVVYKNIARFVATPPCGDFDGDGMVTQADLGILLAAFDNCPCPNCPGDANGDGVVDQQDLGILLANFGQECG
jgi:hypothetical protein